MFFLEIYPSLSNFQMLLENRTLIVCVSINGFIQQGYTRKRTPQHELAGLQEKGWGIESVKNLEYRGTGNANCL